MLDKLNIVKQRFDEVSDLIIQPDIISDQKRYVKLNKEYKDLKLLSDKRDEYITLTNNIQEAEEIIADGSDAEMLEMAKMQLDEAKSALPKLEEEIKYLLILRNMVKLSSTRCQPVLGYYLNKARRFLKLCNQKIINQEKLHEIFTHIS